MGPEEDTAPDFTLNFYCRHSAVIGLKEIIFPSQKYQKNKKLTKLVKKKYLHTLGCLRAQVMPRHWRRLLQLVLTCLHVSLHL